MPSELREGDAVGEVFVHTPSFFPAMAAGVQREAGTKGAVEETGYPPVSPVGRSHPRWAAAPGEPCQEQQPQVSPMATLQEVNGEKCLQVVI